MEMNTCKTIDYTIRIFPEIVHNPYDIVLDAKIELPNRAILCVQEVISIDSIRFSNNKERMARMAAETFTKKISDAISEQVRGVAMNQIEERLYE